MSANCDVIAIFWFYGQFGAFWKLDSRSIFCKTYIFINSSLLSYKNESIIKKSLTSQKITDISNIKEVLLIMGIFYDTKYMCVLT